MAHNLELLLQLGDFVLRLQQALRVVVAVSADSFIELLLLFQLALKIMKSTFKCLIVDWIYSTVLNEPPIRRFFSWTRISECPSTWCLRWLPKHYFVARSLRSQVSRDLHYRTFHIKKKNLFLHWNSILTFLELIDCFLQAADLCFEHVDLGLQILNRPLLLRHEV